MSQPHSHVRNYLIVYVALLVLLGSTVGVAFLPHGNWSALVAMSIATAKMILVLLVFMHLYEAVPLVNVFALSGFLWLAILLAFLASDQHSRSGVVRAQDQQVQVPPEPARSLPLHERAADESH